MKTLAIIIGKITLIFGKILKRGSSLPGKLALFIDKDILKKLKYPEIKIAVTGSSGKGSTSKLIAKVLKDNNYKVTFNNEGSNLDWGIATAILKDCNLYGKITSDALVLEIDERFAKVIFEKINPDYLVLTNLTKDQPPRQHHVDIVYHDIIDYLKPNIKIITNMDDPYLRNIEKDTNNKNIYYSIQKNKYSYKTQIFENLNIYYCPYCNTLLKYDYYNFEALGKYHCPNCDFKYQTPSVLGTNLNLEIGTISINDKEILIGGNMLYHAYNTLAAYTILKELKLKEDNLVKSLNKYNKILVKEYQNNNITFYPISCKAENSTTYNQALFKTIYDNRKKDIIIGWKEISRRYEHFDVSWLYDVEFELLNNETINKIYACGIDKDNIKKRLILAGIKPQKIITSDSIDDIKEKVLKDKIETVYGILNFDYIEPFNKAFKEEEK